MLTDWNSIGSLVHEKTSVPITCGLDSLVQHLIYLVLHPESAPKKELDELQAEVEPLEEELHSPKHSDTTACEEAHLTELYDKRSRTLSRVYADCLTAILPICHDATVYEHLKN